MGARARPGRAGAFILASILWLPLLAGCSSDSTSVRLDRVEITPPIDTLAPGDTVQLRATFFDPSNNPVGLVAVWTALGGVTVTPGGRLTAAYAGSGSVTAAQPGPAANISQTLDLYVRLPHPLVTVALGWNAGCSLDSLAVAYCWGDNSVGELGRAGIPVALGPARVETSLRFATLAVGGSHACGLTAGGASYCWGFNNRGQLGAGALPAGCGSSCSITALAVTGGHSFTALTTGVYHTCGLIADGSAYCWGENGEGQLGTGSVSAGPVSSPQAVAGGLHFKAISAGEFHTCAVTLARAAYCWGANFADQLGIGPSDQTPRLAPQVVVGGLAFDSITSGQAHSCALQSPGAAYCWGIDRGALGTGTTSPGSQSAPVPVTGGLAFVQLTAGTDQSCGRVSDGTVYCWGSGPTTGTGALTAGVVSAPTLVADTLKFAHLAASKLATCGVTVARAVYCWGTPPLLGTADTTVAHRPRRVEGQ